MTQSAEIMKCFTCQAITELSTALKEVNIISHKVFPNVTEMSSS